MNQLDEKTNLDKKKEQESSDFSLTKEERNDLMEEDLLDWENVMIKTLGLSKKEYLEKMKLAKHACELEKMAMELDGNAFKKIQN